MTEQTIFLTALDIPDADKRTAYLTEACAGDAALLRQVESLLAAHDRSGEFLDEPAVEQMGRPNANTITADATSAPPTDDTLTFLQPATPDRVARPARPLRGARSPRPRRVRHRPAGVRRPAAPRRRHQGAGPATGRQRHRPGKRFVREARSAAAVRHEHVVHVYDVPRTTSRSRTW